MSAIVAAVLAALKIAWAWGLPFVGPLLARAAPWLAWVPGLSGIGKSLRVASYVAVLGLGAWGAVRLTHWWEGDKFTPKQARIACNTTIRSAWVTAESNALRTHRLMLTARELRVAADEARIEARTGEMTNAATAPTDREPVLAADDPWLRAWQRRR